MQRVMQYLEYQTERHARIWPTYYLVEKGGIIEVTEEDKRS